MKPFAKTFNWCVELLFAALVMIAIFSPLACSKKSEQKEIKIGVVLCLTGSGAPYGEDVLRGITLATEEINDIEGGIKGKKIKLLIEDDETNPSKAVSATSKLINQNKVKVIIGTVTSSSMLASAPLAEKAKVVMISPGASNPEISKAGDYIFRNWISDELEGKAMVNYLTEVEKVTRVAVLYINNDYGLGLKDVFEHSFTKAGGKIVLVEYYNQDDTDFRTQLAKIKNSDVEVVYMPGYYKEMALILKQAKELNIKTPFKSVVCFEDAELLKLAGDAAEGVVYSSPYYDPKSSKENVVEFVRKFKEKFNREPGIFAAHGYDALKIIAQIIDEVGYSGPIIKDKLYTIKNYKGVSGDTSFDKNGDVIKPVAIKEVAGQKFKFVTLTNIK
jgi:branched-chain amino acid transport system substrate-binding protein